jgi:microcystin degradation protein MlrC
LWSLRDRTAIDLPSAASAVADAISADAFPVALFDTGDNVLGGSAGDSTIILHELLVQKAEGWVVTISDPAAVHEAIRVGLDGHFDLPVGASATACTATLSTSAE